MNSIFTMPVTQGSTNTLPLVYFVNGNGTTVGQLVQQHGLAQCVITSTTSSSVITSVAGGGSFPLTRAGLSETLRHHPRVPLPDDVDYVVELPDGARIEVRADGGYEFVGVDAKVRYRGARRLDFNAYINASDKLEEFVKYCGSLRLTQDELLNLPISTFIAWLCVEAASADGEDLGSELLMLPREVRKHAVPRCQACGRFVQRVRSVLRLCGSTCFERAESRIECA